MSLYCFPLCLLSPGLSPYLELADLADLALRLCLPCPGIASELPQLLCICVAAIDQIADLTFYSITLSTELSSQPRSIFLYFIKK